MHKTEEEVAADYRRETNHDRFSERNKLKGTRSEIKERNKTAGTGSAIKEEERRHGVKRYAITGSEEIRDYVVNRNNDR